MKTSAVETMKQQLKRLAMKAVDRSFADGGVGKDGIQKIIEKRDEFLTDILASIRKHSASNPFANEEVNSSHRYPFYYKPRGLLEQVSYLRKLFSGIGSADENIARQALPTYAEGWFAIPRWETLAEDYNAAVQKVFDKIRRAWNGRFFNHHFRKIGSQYLRQSCKTMAAIEKITKDQKGQNILVIPAQFGLHHRGRSVRRAVALMNTDEFGLGVFAVGIMILTHWERFHQTDDLWIDCAGDEYAPLADGNFVSAPYFRFENRKIWFATAWNGDCDSKYGSASGFFQH